MKTQRTRGLHLQLLASSLQCLVLSACLPAIHVRAGPFVRLDSGETTGTDVDDEEYLNREIWQCLAHQQNQMYRENPAHTSTLYEHNGMIAFATSKNFDYFESVHSMSHDDCHHFGKVRNVLGQSRSTVQIQGSKPGWFQRYHPLHEITAYYQTIAKKFPDLAKLVPSIGKTVQGRDIFAVHVAASAKPTSKVYIQCLIHAREWVSGSVCQYFTGYLVKKMSTDKKFKDSMKELEFVIVPVVNPDGYVKTMSKGGIQHRFWRKNVRSNGLGHCAGVDLNRNFDFHWKSAKGSSGAVCQQNYRGPAVESEPETQAIIQYIRKVSPVLGAIDFHSYSQLVLYPYVWSSAVPAHVQALTEIAQSVSAAIKKVHGYQYSPMRGDKFFYPASGTFSDWVYKSDVAKTNKDSSGRSSRIIPMSIELRPKGRLGVLGFALAEEEILPTCQEATAGVIRFTREIVKRQHVFRE